MTAGDTPQTKQQQIARLVVLQKALILPEDANFHEMLQQQIDGLKVAINAEKPLDKQIEGLTEAITRKREKHAKNADQIAELMLHQQSLEAEVNLKEQELTVLKQRKAAELNIVQAQMPSPEAANQVQLLMQQVASLQTALMQMQQQGQQ